MPAVRRPLLVSAATSARTLAIALVVALAALMPTQSALAGASAAASPGWRQPRGIAAPAAEVANAANNRQLWGREQYTQRPIASITKLMTALVVADAGDLRRRITITWAERNYVVDNGASNAGLRPGDTFTAGQLLYAMLLPSGADAAMALAISYGPGVRAFVRKMNATARRLGLRWTHFTNFDGLESSDISTPGNLLRLGEAAMGQAAIRDVVGRRFYWLPRGHGHGSYLWRNSNLLLRRYPGVIGIKTGWTPAAGECLLFEAVYGKRTLIGVVLDSEATNSGQSFVDAARLLNWGFGLNEPVGSAGSFGRIPGD